MNRPSYRLTSFRAGNARPGFATGAPFVDGIHSAATRRRPMQPERRTPMRLDGNCLATSRIGVRRSDPVHGRKARCATGGRPWDSPVGGLSVLATVERTCTLAADFKGTTEAFGQAEHALGFVTWSVMFDLLVS